MDRDRSSEAGREGFGDDQGTRVGRPDSGRERASPSTRPDEHGKEGSILDGAQTQRGTDEESSTGAGAEAAEGVHSAQRNRNPSDKSGVANARPESGASSTSGQENRAGSEPLPGRTTEHKGSYGGEGGDPRGSGP